MQLLLNLVHVRLEGEPEVVLVLAEHIDQSVVISFQSGCHLVERASHLPYIVLEGLNHRVSTGAPACELLLDLVDESRENYGK